MNPAEGDFVASIIVPAHNEEAVIGRLLAGLPREIDGRPVQVIVACNGCSDGTAEVAREHGVDVVEVGAASKVAALNAGDEAARVFPRLYVDADIVITPRSVVDVVRTLRVSGALCAALPSTIDLDGRAWAVRSYLRFWHYLMQVRDGYVGCGVYALSREGRARFDEFPNVIADDAFVRNLFTLEERVTVDSDPTIVEAPRTLGALFRRRVRVCAGNMQLEGMAFTRNLPANSERRKSWWQIALTQPKLIPDAVVYAGLTALSRIVAAAQLRRRGDVAWGRDKTTRSGAL